MGVKNENRKEECIKVDRCGCNLDCFLCYNL